MSENILIISTRRLMPAMLEKLDETVQEVQAQHGRVIVGEAPGGDEQVRKCCERLGVEAEVWGARGQIRQPEINPTGEVRHTITGGSRARNQVMAKRCNRGIAVMRAPRTRGTWETGRYVEAEGKPVRWALWDETAQTWAYYDRSEDIPREESGSREN